MFQRTRLCSGIVRAFGPGLVAGVGLGMFGSMAVAQSVERVEVTGSLIRRIVGETALPVTTLRIDELQRAGATNAEQVVRFITQNQGGSVSSGSVSGTNGAASYASLRNLGAGRTLVLLNGKRVVSNPFSSAAVDLNTLPLAAIARIETLSDGASATYGTDAIAGVINFITKKDYKGLELAAQAQVPTNGGGEVYNGSVIGGIGNLANDGWNIYGGLSVRKQEPMRGTDRDFSVTSYMPALGFNGLSPTTFPANYSQTNAAGATVIANTNPSLPGCQAPTSILASAVATNRCNADTQAFTQTVPDQDQQSIFVRGALALGGGHQASVEYFHSMNRITSLIAPSPEGGLTMTNASPYFPGNGLVPITNAALDPNRPISIAWRTTVLGSRSGKQENNTQRLVAGLEGSWGNWDYQAALLWSNAKVENFFLNGYPMTQPLRNGVSGTNGAPFLNPFGDQSAVGLAYLQTNQVLGKVQEGEGTLQSLTASASTTLGSLPGGPIGLALATELRKEEMVYRTDIAKVSQAASSGLAGSGALREGDRDISALSVELNLPVLKGLELGVSVRADKYSDFGNTVNPKFSLRYAPTSNLVLRGSYNRGFSAPTLTDLYAPNATTFTGNRYNDPVLCPGGVPTANAVPSRDCGIQFQRLTGGNANLKAEKSKAWTIGFVLQPTNDITVSMDLWDYAISSSVSSIGDATIFADPVKYAAYFIRCSQASAERRNAIGACQNPGNVDPLAYVLDTNQNLGDVKTRGVDVAANWQSSATAYGRFNVGLRGSYVSKYEFQVEQGGAWFNPLGRWEPRFTSAGTSGGPVIRYQQVVNVGWDFQTWTASATHRLLSGYRDQNTQGAPFTAFNNHDVSSHETIDLSLTWRGIKGLTLQGAVLNVFDKEPPFTNQTARFQARGYDDRFHNPLGRTVQVSARYEF